MSVRHPAKYTDCLLPIFAEWLRGRERVLDPFAGTGKLRQVRPDAYLIEIEPEWAAIGGAIVGDALRLPFASGVFDAICTSPTYGNRMADSFTDHQTAKNYRRNTYTHAIGRKLHPNNSGQMQWGKAYQDFHRCAWGECWRVLRPGGVMVLNISDHIRNGKVIDVTAWHVRELTGMGFEYVKSVFVETPRQRFGANGDKRVPGESVILFRKPTLWDAASGATRGR